MNWMRYSTILCVAAAWMMALPLPARALDKLTSPIVDKGELELEYGASRTFDRNNSKDNEQGHELEIEYGVSNHLALELGIEFEREPGEKIKSEAVEVGGKWQFFDQGKYWLDSGLEFGYEHATHHGDADKLMATLLLQKEWGKTLHVANFELEQEIGSNAEGGA